MPQTINMRNYFEMREYEYTRRMAMELDDCKIRKFGSEEKNLKEIGVKTI